MTQRKIKHTPFYWAKLRVPPQNEEKAHYRLVSNNTKKPIADKVFRESDARLIAHAPQLFDLLQQCENRMIQESEMYGLKLSDKILLKLITATLDASAR